MYGHVVTDILYPHLCQPSSIVIKAQEVWWKYVKSLDFNLNFCKDLLMSNKFVNKRHCLLVESTIIKIPHAEDKNPFTKRLFCFFALHFYVGLQVYKKKPRIINSCTKNNGCLILFEDKKLSTQTVLT